MPAFRIYKIQMKQIESGNGLPNCILSRLMNVTHPSRLSAFRSTRCDLTACFIFILFGLHVPRMTDVYESCCIVLVNFNEHREHP